MFIDVDAAESAAEELRLAGDVVNYSSGGPGYGSLRTTSGLDQGAAALMPYAVLEAVGAVLACKSSVDIGYHHIAEGLDDAAEITRFADRLDVD